MPSAKSRPALQSVEQLSVHAREPGASVKSTRVTLPRPQLTPGEKQRAAERLEAAKDAKASFNIIVSVLALPAVLTGVGVPYGLVAAVFVALLDREQRRSERAVNDPPRPDYAATTQAQRPRVDVAMALEGTEFAEPAISAGEALRTQIAYLSALVRALERAQGASAAADEQSYGERLEDVYEFVRQISGTASAARAELTAFADVLSERSALAEIEAEPPRALGHGSGDASRSSGRIQQKRYIARLRAAGVSVGEFPTRRATGEDVAAAASALRRLGVSIEEFAGELRSSGIELTR
jgi:hypothetical protein